MLPNSLSYYSSLCELQRFCRLFGCKVRCLQGPGRKYKGVGLLGVEPKGVVAMPAKLMPAEDASQTCALLKDQPMHVQKVELFLFGYRCVEP